MKINACIVVAQIIVFVDSINRYARMQQSMGKFVDQLTQQQVCMDICKISHYKKQIGKDSVETTDSKKKRFSVMSQRPKRHLFVFKVILPILQVEIHKVYCASLLTTSTT
eukprot:TRINITY_DN5126_c0_g4_i2.p21 TRINITY_DN5126_c0_g4~~TRINITY_DN5126_c0_g4_i2.p21  ORF type:complete len:110 (-),score=3.51 TRINITY_DN5126_c0_g4_i2:277-606(-)